MKLAHTIISTSIALALVGCSSGPVTPKNEWRREVASSQETKFPGINYGMTEQQVRRKIPTDYTLIDNQKNILSQTPELSSIIQKQGPSTRFIRADRLHKEERIIEVIHFVFVKGKLKFAYSGYGAPLH
jgi:hypothetical protein